MNYEALKSDSESDSESSLKSSTAVLPILLYDYCLLLVVVLLLTKF